MPTIFNRILLSAVCCLLMSPVAAGWMRASPKIASVAIAADNLDVICLHLNNAPCKVALSNDGGQTFQPIDEREIPAGLTTTLSNGTRRYVVAGDSDLFRSDDSGETWKKTESGAFIHNLIQERIDQCEKEFWNHYGSRLPSRSALWHPLFGAFAIGHLVLSLFALRAQGWLKASWTGLRGVAVMLLVWCVLMGFHAVFRDRVESQYPLAYWISTASNCPSPKLGLAMAITARPLPLLAYLLALWPLLPGSLCVVDFCLRAQPPLRQRVARALALGVGCLFVVFHGCLLGIGYFWE